MRIGAVDIGGSGCRVVAVEVTSTGARVLGEPDRLPAVNSSGELAAEVRRVLGEVDGLGVAAAGFVDARRGAVRLSRVAPWTEGPLRDRLAAELGCAVQVVNDGEAHLRAHASLGEHPMLCFAAGTSMAFGCTDDDGVIRRPRGDSNWDLGSLRIPTSASNPEVWWALGSRGLEELQASKGEQGGAEHFGWRLGALVHDFSVLFQPRPVVLTGGIVRRHRDVVVASVREELRARLPGHVEPPTILTSPYEDASALVGAALTTWQGAAISR